MAPLSYYGEVSVPGMDKNQIYNIIDNWIKENRNDFNIWNKHIDFDSLEHSRELIISRDINYDWLHDYHHNI